jgi:hypothetical protein
MTHTNNNYYKGCYTESIDKPYLNDHIFLLFETNVNNIDVIKSLQQRKDFYTKYYITNDNKPYTVITLIKNDKWLKSFQTVDFYRFGKTYKTLPLDEPKEMFPKQSSLIVI